MSCIICDDTLPQNAPPPNFQRALGVSLGYKPYGFPQYAFIKKSTVISDPTVISNWTDACTNGDLKMGPCGVITIGAPSFTTSEDGNACNLTEVVETIFTPTYHFYKVDRDNLTHIEYLEHVLAAHKCWDVIYFDCDGNPHLSKEARDVINGVSAAPMTSGPGLEFSMIQTPHVVPGDANNEKWQFQLQNKLSGEQMMAPVKIPGLFEALIAC